jgi:hypothetical protein
VRRNLSAANVMAALALFISLSGTAWAAATIGTGDIRDGAIQSRDIGNGQVTQLDIKSGTVGLDELGAGAETALKAPAVQLAAQLRAGTGVVNDAANPASWTQLKDVPGGFADGTDDTGAGSVAAATSANDQMTLADGTWTAVLTRTVSVPTAGTALVTATVAAFGPAGGFQLQCNTTLNTFQFGHDAVEIFPNGSVHRLTVVTGTPLLAGEQTIGLRCVSSQSNTKVEARSLNVFVAPTG